MIRPFPSRAGTPQDGAPLVIVAVGPDADLVDMTITAAADVPPEFETLNATY